MRQVYENYTAEDQEVWESLFDRQYPCLQQSASDAYLQGLQHLDFHRASIPQFDHINAVLQSKTAWQLAVVPGIVPNYTFFELMSNKHFPATTWLRKRAELDYLPEPDMFHDVFAHVPLLTNKYFVSFLEHLSQIGLRYCENEWAIECLSRIYWFSVEFGLIREPSGLKVYGAGILSSHGEVAYALGNKVPYIPFQVDEMMDTPFKKDVFQDRYFFIDSYQQLYDAVPQIEHFLKTRQPEQA